MENGTTAAQRIERRGCKLALVCGALALAWTAVSSAATEAPRGSVVLWSGDDQWVKIEPQDDPAAVPNDHPARLDVQTITSALGALQVHLVDPDTGSESHRPVFTQAELGNLTQYVASGLAKAGPRQDVTFSTIDGRSLAAGGLVRKPGVNAGRVFYNDGRLNVIFGELQSSYRKKNVYGQRSEDFTPRRLGSRSEASEQKWALEAGPGLAFHSTGGGDVRNDWVMIDTAVARTEALPAPPSNNATARQTTSAPAATAPAAAAAGAAAVTTSPPVNAPAAIAPSVTPPVASAPVTTAPAAVTPAPAAAKAPVATVESAPKTGKPNADLEQRLRQLKELRDKGLITEEAYRAKMQELLSEL